jgi:hypothetical protein
MFVYEPRTEVLVLETATDIFELGEVVPIPALPVTLRVVPTYSALATPTPPAVIIDPVEVLVESVVRLELIPAAKGMRTDVVV